MDEVLDEFTSAHGDVVPSELRHRRLRLNRMNRSRSIRLLSSLALVTALAACTSNPQASPQTETVTENASTMPVQLVRTGACGDAYFWAESADGNIAVTVDVTYSPVGADVTLAIPFSLPDRQVKIRVLKGHDLSRNFCTDLITTSSEPESTSAAVAGEGQVTIAPAPNHGSACGRTLGTLNLRGLVAEDGTEFSPITVESRDIGCYSG